MASASKWLLFTLFSIAHFFLWKYIGENQLLGAIFLAAPDCQHVFTAPQTAPSRIPSSCQAVHQTHTPLSCQAPQVNSFRDDSFQVTNAAKLHQFRGDALTAMKFPVVDASVINFQPQHSCKTLISPYISRSTACFAVVATSSTSNALPLQRFNFDTSKTGKVISTASPVPAGFFRNVASSKGRVALNTKLHPLLASLLSIEAELVAMLERRGIERGDDITVLVTNEGEVDLLLNFVCSCRHHHISLNNIVVFAGSK